MLALWFLGPQLELAIGRARFLALYLHLRPWPARRWSTGSRPQTAPTLGASGAIFGLMGALLVLAFKVGGNVAADPDVDRHQLPDHRRRPRLHLLAGPPRRLPRRRPDRRVLVYPPGPTAPCGSRRPRRVTSASWSRSCSAPPSSPDADPSLVTASRRSVAVHSGSAAVAPERRRRRPRLPQLSTASAGCPSPIVGSGVYRRARGHSHPQLCTTVESPVENYIDVVLHRVVPNVQNRRPIPRGTRAGRLDASARRAAHAGAAVTPSGWRR